MAKLAWLAQELAVKERLTRTCRETGRLTGLVQRTDQEESESGFTILELMVVIAIILIFASLAAPIYSRIITRSHEAVLRDDLFTMRKLIDQYTLDNRRPPESLDDLVQAGYLKGGLPVDPFTGQIWQPAAAGRGSRAISALRLPNARRPGRARFPGHASRRWRPCSQFHPRLRRAATREPASTIPPQWVPGLRRRQCAT